MARTSKSGGESKSGGDNKTPKAPTRRRNDKARPAAKAAANDSVSAATGVATTSESNGGPSPAEVQRLAFELYVQRGCCNGHDKDDWYEAERQLRQRH
jgi:hypothetical protein